VRALLSIATPHNKSTHNELGFKEIDWFLKIIDTHLYIPNTKKSEENRK